MKKLLVILLPVLGLVGGGVAGSLMRPPEPAADPVKAEAAAPADPQGEAAGEHAYIRIGRQTIIPVVEGGETRALMLFELAVDAAAGEDVAVQQMEPRLRDAFLRELFRMSSTGAFLTNFTEQRVIDELRRNLVRAAREHLGERVQDVLILDVMRQEL